VNNSVLFHDAAGRTYPVEGPAWSAPDGTPFAIAPTLSGLDPPPFPLLSLGETPTPVVDVDLGGHRFRAKLEYRQPSGSFKDRGARMLLSAIHARGIREVVEDSSGNAGAALALYAAAAGIRCRIVIPRGARGPVVRQIAATGAELVLVAGPRARAAERAHEIARSCYYASHVYNPLFHAGTAGIAAELDAQGEAPDTIILPVGNGTLLLGLYHGFSRLGKVPRLIAAQAAGLSPIVAAVHEAGPPAMGPAGDAGASRRISDRRRRRAEKEAAALAPGIAVTAPARLAEIVEAVRGSGGDAVSVDLEAVRSAQRELALQGHDVEATSAVAAAAACELVRAGRTPELGRVMVILTGAGWKR
jgi:threonine synthase